MKSEERMFRAAIYAGFTEIFVALLLVFLGVATKLWETFHIFGYLGMSLIFYGGWHWFLWRNREKE